jgi:hypothetical protein
MGLGFANRRPSFVFMETLETADFQLGADGGNGLFGAVSVVAVSVALPPRFQLAPFASTVLPAPQVQMQKAPRLRGVRRCS